MSCVHEHALLERPGEVVAREELRGKLWPADRFVDFDEGLNIAIKKLRHAWEIHRIIPLLSKRSPGTATALLLQSKFWMNQTLRMGPRMLRDRLASSPISLRCQSTRTLRQDRIP